MGTLARDFNEIRRFLSMVMRHEVLYSVAFRSKEESRASGCPISHRATQKPDSFLQGIHFMIDEAVLS